MTQLQPHTSDVARRFLLLAFGYLGIGLLFGVIAAFQYLLPGFMKESLSFARTRPLHVYLVISWIFTAAQGIIYGFLPDVAGRSIRYPSCIRIHFYLQVYTSLLVIAAFLSGYFGGREYLEFPPWMGILIFISWLPFARNFFTTLKPVFRNAPVYIWSWSTGIIFFFITLSESYLWLFDFFGKNTVRDITIQWKALGSMVGSWNMLVFGSAMYVMEKIGDNKKIAYSPSSFFFYFLGLANLMFNWGHHTYIVPAEPWVKNVSYLVSMTELLLLGMIMWKWRRTVRAAKKNYQDLSFRTLSIADGWIFINLVLAIIMSVPAWNYFTHGTHITVAHAMGATVGINTMLLFGIIFYVLKKEYAVKFELYKKRAATGMMVMNVSLFVFWLSLIASGLVTISGKLNNKGFYEIMSDCLPWFRVFSLSGVGIFAGLLIAIRSCMAVMRKPAIRVNDKDQVQTAHSSYELVHGENIFDS